MSRKERQKGRVSVPTVEFGGSLWGDLSVFGKDHDFCATRAKANRDMSFIGGHRVRSFTFKQMVHWKIPTGVELDISEVDAPRRRFGS